MAQIRVYADIIRGFVEYTGNTVQMYNASNQEVQCAIAPGPPSGTFTTQGAWRTNGSAAFLRGLTGSTVQKAFLAWMGTVVPNVNGTAVNQNIAVTFKTPTSTHSITGNPAWSQQVTGFGQQYNIRVADVTTILQGSGLGQYSVEGIPSGANYTGWTLAVVWKNSSLPPRFISVDTFDDLVVSPNTLSITVGGFITGSTGPVNGRAAMVIGSAENWTVSGPTAFGPTTASLVNLIGPNNPVNNFFQMQINNSNSESVNVGQLDQTGTFGTLNPLLNQATPNPNVRYHWDMTNVSINSGLTTNQTQGIFRFGPVNNAYVIHLLSLQIDVKSPTLDTVKSVNKTQVQVGEVITYTLEITNTGNFGTDNLVVLDTIPTGTSFNAGTLTLDGVTVPAASPLPPSGFEAGSIAEGQTKKITFNITALSQAAYTTINNTFGTVYRYTPGAGITLNGSTSSNTVGTFVYGNTSIANTKSVNKSFADVGDTLIYTINLRNLGTATATGIVVRDTIPEGTTFVVNSLAVDGTTISGANPAPPTGYTINSLAPATTLTLTFQVRVNSIPSTNPVPNSAVFSYDYQTTITNTVINDTNQVLTQINNANLNTAIKYTDKSYAACGDTISYTIVIPNSGNVTAQDIVLKDTIPSGTTFVANSVYIDSVPKAGADPSAGFTLPNLAPGTRTTVTFQVRVSC